MDQKIQNEIQERLGRLLAESPLTEDLKKLLLDSLDKLPDYFIFDLIDMLEKEKIEVERVTMDVREFLRRQSQEWEKTEEDQRAAVEKIIQTETGKIEDEFKLEEARKTLDAD